jgi:hypothetical protein
MSRQKIHVLVEAIDLNRHGRSVNGRYLIAACGAPE